MIINKAYKFRIYPTKEQELFFAKHFGCSRFIYNHFLALRKKAWKEEKKTISGFECKKMISKMKKTEEYSWLKEVNSQSLQESCLNLEKAYKRFFKKLGDKPKFHKKNHKQSFIVPQHFSVNETEGTIQIPKLKSTIKVTVHRKLKEVIKFNSLTISKEPSGKYFVSINVDNLTKEHKKTSNKIGIDLGIKDFLVNSDGDKTKHPRYLKQSLKKLKKTQKKLSKKQKGSSNRNKYRLKIAKIHERISNQRSDFLHKLSFNLIDKNQVIYLEDLNVKGMMKNRKLAQSIGDSGWGEFARQLKYKANWYGREIIQIGRFEPSSKLCSSCGYKNDKLELSMRQWECPDCKIVHDRDINAAKNILKIGQEVPKLKPVEKVTAVFSIKRKQVASVKQEPLCL